MHVPHTVDFWGQGSPISSFQFSASPGLVLGSPGRGGSLTRTQHRAEGGGRCWGIEWLWAKPPRRSSLSPELCLLYFLLKFPRQIKVQSPTGVILLIIEHLIFSSHFLSYRLPHISLQCLQMIYFHSNLSPGFPGGSDSKESACSAGDLRSVPGLGRSPVEGNDYSLQYSCLENPLERSLVGYGPWVPKSEIGLSNFQFLLLGEFKLTRVLSCRIPNTYRNDEIVIL